VDDHDVVLVVVGEHGNRLEGHREPLGGVVGEDVALHAEQRDVPVPRLDLLLDQRSGPNRAGRPGSLVGISVGEPMSFLSAPRSWCMNFTRTLTVSPASPLRSSTKFGVRLYFLDPAFPAVPAWSYSVSE
jgi:hypothetical protein